LKALDTNAEREVEAYLRSNPEAPGKLELLRQALEPLEADRQEILPPPGLRMRTLGRVADHGSLVEEPMPASPPVLHVAPASWWRRADVLVAASLLFICLPLALPLLTTAHRAYRRQQCENNLRGLWGALMAYSDHHHGDLPKVEEEPPANFAGAYVPILSRDGLLQHVSLGCPANGTQPASSLTLEELSALQRTEPRRFEEYVRQLGGCYAYPLGYRSQGRLYGLRREANAENDNLPVLADRPPFENADSPELLTANSENHGGKGQNILFLGGNVAYRARNAGPYANDIFLNANRQLKPGIARWDTVLAASGVRAEHEAPPEH
jgi:hypothetical protein